MADASTIEDDDNWLYGDSNALNDETSQSSKQEEKENISIAFGDSNDAEKGSEGDPVPKEAPPPETSEAEESLPKPDTDKDATADTTQDSSIANDTSRASHSESEDDDDDDDDDEVQVTIGDIKTTPPQFGYGGPGGGAGREGGGVVNLNLKRGSGREVGGYGASAKASPAHPRGGLDPDTIGSINGISLYEFNLDSLEDKPWRKPGADITDYFNYGFTEETWKAYCEKQKKLRTENCAQVKVISSSSTGNENLIAIPTVNENSKYSSHQGLKKAGPPPGRKMSGNIDVIGAASLPSRRPGGGANVIQVMAGGGRKYDVPMGMPPLHLPPPHFPPPFIAPDVTMPPPNLPPPMVPPTVIGTSASYPPEMYDTYSLATAPETDHQSNAYYGNNKYDDSWQSSRSSDKHRYYNDEDYERSCKRHRDSSDRVRTSSVSSKERDRYDDRYDRERERDRERRHRSERERDKEKDERRSSRRRHHHDDETRSSRHKHKRARRDREESESSSHYESKSKDSAPDNQDDTNLEEGEEKD